MVIRFLWLICGLVTGTDIGPVHISDHVFTKGASPYYVVNDVEIRGSG